MNGMNAVQRRFAEDLNLSDSDAKKLIRLANLAQYYGDRATGDAGASPKEDDYGNQFEQFVTKLGLGCMWPGTRPVIKKDGIEYFIPQ